jgi:hypothetical protein
MPLFNRNDSVKTQESVPAPSPVATDNTNTHRHSGIFSSRRSSRTSPVRNGNTTQSVHTNGSTNGSPKPGLIHRDTEDASITAARERVINAEAAERDADKALVMAKSAVKEAMEHVKRVEREAAEQ